MRTLFLLPLGLALAFEGTTLATAQEGKSELVAAGRDVALKICANCHVVAKDQSSPPTLKPPAPSFSAIAARPEATRSSLRSFLANPHGEPRQSGKMPGFMLAESQIDEVVAYILSLRESQERSN
jgi:mono/diheme cytochrome c family protein